MVFRDSRQLEESRNGQSCENDGLRPVPQAGQEHRRVRRNSSDHGEGCEDGRTGEEDAPSAEHVGQAASGHNEDAEYHGVAVDDPLHRGDVGVESALDGGSATESAVKSLATTRTATPMAIMPRIVALLRRSSVTAIRQPLSVPAEFRTKAITKISRDSRPFRRSNLTVVTLSATVGSGS